MTTITLTIPDELKALIEREVAAGGYTSKDELMRDALQYWCEHRETIAALNEAIDDLEAGRMRSLEEFDREFRAEHGIPDCRP